MNYVEKFVFRSSDLSRIESTVSDSFESNLTVDIRENMNAKDGETQWDTYNIY